MHRKQTIILARLFTLFTYGHRSFWYVHCSYFDWYLLGFYFENSTRWSFASVPPRNHFLESTCIYFTTLVAIAVVLFLEIQLNLYIHIPCVAHLKSRLYLVINAKISNKCYQYVIQQPGPLFQNVSQVSNISTLTCKVGSIVQFSCVVKRGPDAGTLQNA